MAIIKAIRRKQLEILARKEGLYLITELDLHDLRMNANNINAANGMLLKELNSLMSNIDPVTLKESLTIGFRRSQLVRKIIEIDNWSEAILKLSDMVYPRQ